MSTFTMKAKKMFPITGLMSALIMTSAIAQAECMSHVHDQQPQIPDGLTASKSEMLSAQGELKAYVDKVQRDVKCVGDDFGHDASLKRLKKLVAHYNQELVMFNEKSKMAQR